MKPLPKKYKHSESEKRWQTQWESEGVYAWDESQPRENTYVIDTPPPTVSGMLHMGHVFSYVQADFVARYQRMRGKTVFYPMGFDDNGLPTERLVEKVKKIRAVDLGREKFIEQCEDVAEGARKEFRELFESVALSVDWKQEYHTISERSRTISQMSFLDLYNKGEVYRKLQPMLWDPVDQTAIAQAEVEDKEVATTFNDILFGIEGSDEQITIGTTRPELLPACVAVFYHPEDERYNGQGAGDDCVDLREKVAITPLFGVKVPLLADENVKIDKGTGLVMCCTFGDETDIVWWRSHELSENIMIDKYARLDFTQLDGSVATFTNIQDIFAKVRLLKSMQGFSKYLSELHKSGIIAKIDKDWTPTDLDENEYSGTHIMTLRVIDVLLGDKFSNELNGTEKAPISFKVCKDLQKKKIRPNPNKKGESAREKILDWLDREGLLVKSEEIVHAEPCAERSGAPLEILPTYQWFVKVLDKKDELRAKADECVWHPEYMKQRVYQWIDGLNWDWCISRQRYFGVPFPVWYSKRAGEEGKIIYAKPEQLPVNPLVDLPDGYSKDEVEPEADVMDTWATSSVSPQLNSWGINAQNSLSPTGERAGVRGLRNEQLIKNAKDLRQNQTDAEKLLWNSLKNRQLSDMKFRRQHDIDPYIVDFVCLEKRIIIELDGGQHNEDSVKKYDEKRTSDLESKGYRVLRFWNNDVLNNIDGVMESIAMALDNTPHPNPLPTGGEGMQYAIDADRHAKLFPADLRPQAHEIIRTWAFYTIAKALLHENTIPWKNLMISGWCLASDKTKMSKSKGNVITPVSLIEEKGADVVRFWASTSKLGADTAYSEDVLKIGKKLVTKLWNATKFAAIHLDKMKGAPATANADIDTGVINETLDLWVLSKLKLCVQKSTESFDKYEYSNARSAVEDFFWNDFCDNYLELVKVRVYGEAEGTTEAGQQSAVRTIYYCLDGILRLFAPFVPHITEELFSHIFDEEYAKNGSLHATGTWADAANYPENTQAIASGTACVSVLDTVRKMKAEKAVSIKWPLESVVIEGEGAETLLSDLVTDLANVTNAKEVAFAEMPSKGDAISLKSEDGNYCVHAIFAEESEGIEKAG